MSYGIGEETGKQTARSSRKFWYRQPTVCYSISDFIMTANVTLETLYIHLHSATCFGHNQGELQ